MQKLFALAGVGVLALLLSAANCPAAPVAWAYQWEPSATVIHANPVFYPLVLPRPGPIPILPWPPPGSGQAAIHLSDGPREFAAGSSDVLATRVWTSSPAPANLPGRFTDRTYSLSIKLTDEANHRSGVLTFDGRFDGTVWAHGSDITNHFTNARTQSLILGLDVFTVTIGPYLPPGPPGWWNAGAIGAHVNVHFLEPPPLGGGVHPLDLAMGSQPPMATPEPSAAVLAGLGALFGGLATWRKTRRS